jgi:hypothetical protein
MMPIRQIIMSDDVANEECLNPEDFLKERERERARCEIFQKSPPPDGKVIM